MDTKQRIYIRDMQRQIVYSVEGGFYYTARKQLRDLIDHTRKLESDTNTTAPQKPATVPPLSPVFV